jgi:outer membrane receptor protein involved in Fe transport
LSSLDLKLTGSLLALPTGQVKYAAGGQYRRESLDSANLVAHSDFSPSRNIGAAYVELEVPLIKSDLSSPAHPPLVLSLAGRYEHYSDFGRTFNPNAGIIWHPVRFLRLRSTYGTSFKAPLLSQENPVLSGVTAQAEADPDTAGFTNVLQEFGGNRNLRPETAHVWTAGFDVADRGVSVKATYYNIRFSNVISNIQAEGISVSNALESETALGPTVIIRNPPASEVSALAGTPGFVDLIPGLLNLSTIGALVDSRELNLASIRTSGIDLDAQYIHSVATGTLEAGVSASYVIDFWRQQTSDIPLVSVLNTVYNPVNLKARARIIYRLMGLTAAAYVNFINSYKDTNAAPTIPVSSWATLDFTVRYASQADSGILAGSAVSISVLNAANKAPPYVRSPSPLFEPGVTFDGANANVLGRFLSFELAKKW